MGKISLLDSTIKTPIDELAKNIAYKVSKKLQASLFSIQGDARTDIAQLLQLLVSIYFN